MPRNHSKFYKNISCSKRKTYDVNVCGKLGSHNKNSSALTVPTEESFEFWPFPFLYDNNMNVYRGPYSRWVCPVKRLDTEYLMSKLIELLGCPNEGWAKNAYFGLLDLLEHGDGRQFSEGLSRNGMDAFRKLFANKPHYSPTWDGFFAALDIIERLLISSEETRRTCVFGLGIFLEPLLRIYHTREKMLQKGMTQEMLGGRDIHAGKIGNQKDVKILNKTPIRKLCNAFTLRSAFRGLTKLPCEVKAESWLRRLETIVALNCGLESEEYCYAVSQIKRWFPTYTSLQLDPKCFRPKPMERTMKMVIRENQPKIQIRFKRRSKQPKTHPPKEQQQFEASDSTVECDGLPIQTGPPAYHTGPGDNYTACEKVRIKFPSECASRDETNEVSLVSEQSGGNDTKKRAHSLVGHVIDKVLSAVGAEPREIISNTVLDVSSTEELPIDSDQRHTQKKARSPRMYHESKEHHENHQASEHLSHRFLTVRHKDTDDRGKDMLSMLVNRSDMTAPVYFVAEPSELTNAPNSLLSSEINEDLNYQFTVVESSAVLGPTEEDAAPTIANGNLDHPSTTMLEWKLFRKNKMNDEQLSQQSHASKPQGLQLMDMAPGTKEEGRLPVKTNVALGESSHELIKIRVTPSVISIKSVNEVIPLTSKALDQQPPQAGNLFVQDSDKHTQSERMDAHVKESANMKPIQSAPEVYTHTELHESAQTLRMLDFSDLTELQTNPISWIASGITEDSQRYFIDALLNQHHDFPNILLNNIMQNWATSSDLGNPRVSADEVVVLIPENKMSLSFTTKPTTFELSNTTGSPKVCIRVKLQAEVLGIEDNHSNADQPPKIVVDLAPTTNVSALFDTEDKPTHESLKDVSK